MRLDKLLEKARIGSRTEVKKMIKNQKVVLDGKIAQSISQKVDTGFQELIVDGKKIEGYSHHYFLIHKPAGYVTARLDQNHPTLFDLLKPEDRVEGLYPVGRLDRDTEGLVLVTDNGPLGFRMLHPSHHVEKTYYVEVNGFLGEDAPLFFRSGIVFLDGTVCKPAVLEVINCQQNLSKAYLTISEGKFHQVKKMFLSYGLKVTYLRRVSFAGLSLGNLPLGKYRPLDWNEKLKLIAFFD